MSNEELAARAKTGDNDALMALWEAVRRLCFQIARRYKNMLGWAGYTDEDIEQTLFLAFYAALDAFDPSDGNKFTSYLQYPIMSTLRAVLNIRDGKQLPPAPVSLDCPLDDDESCTRGDLLPDSRAEQAFEDAESRVWSEQLHSALEKCLDSIDEQTAAIIRSRFFDGLTREALAKQSGISTARAQQLERKGMRQLRQGKNLRRLKAFRDEIISTQAYHATGFNAWKSGGSVEERILLRLEELESNPEPEKPEIKTRY